MKYFYEGKNENGYGDEAIVLEESIFSVAITKDNNIVIMEECDGCFERKFTKQEAIEMFEEAINYIKVNAQ